jgi:ribose-phosphate pyrophosphokinase
MHRELKVFSGNSNKGLAKEICRHLNIPLSKLDISRFSNDNLFVQVKENVREKDVFVIQSSSRPVSNHIMELLITLRIIHTQDQIKKTLPESPLPGDSWQTC